MSLSELLEAIQRYYGNDKDTIRAINDLLGDIESNPNRFVVRLSELLEEFALRNQECPLCGEELEFKNDRLECIVGTCGYSTTIPF